MALSLFHNILQSTDDYHATQDGSHLLSVFASSDIESLSLSSCGGHVRTAFAWPEGFNSLRWRLACQNLRGDACNHTAVHEGKQSILIVVPTPLLYQWRRVIEDKFTMPLVRDGQPECSWWKHRYRQHKCLFARWNYSDHLRLRHRTSWQYRPDKVRYHGLWGSAPFAARFIQAKIRAQRQFVTQQEIPINFS